MKTKILIIALIFTAATLNVSAQEKKSGKNLFSINEDIDNTEVQVPGVNIKVNEFGDTLSIITLGHKRFEIIEDHQTVKVRMTKVPHEKFKGHLAGFDLGINTLVTSDFSTNLPDDARFLDLNSGKSVHVGINFMQYSIGLQKNRNNLGFVTGMGLNFSNYRFDSQNILIKDPITGNTIGELVDTPVKKNKLTTAFINVPLLLELQIPSKEEHRFFVSAGGYCGFNLGAHTKVIYDDGGKKDKQKSHGNLNVQPFQYGLSARMGYRFIKLFANYNLSPLFDDGKGPEVYPFSIGLTLINI